MGSASERHDELGISASGERTLPFWVQITYRWRRWRDFLAASIDIAAWFVALVACTSGRYDLRLPAGTTEGLLAGCLIGGAALLVFGALNGLHRGRYQVGSYEEVIAVTQSFLVTGLLLVVVNQLFDPRLVPMSAALLSPPLGIVLALMPRLLLRWNRDGAMAPNPAVCRRVLVFGAGDAGSQVVRALLRDPLGLLLPIGFIDDDPAKANRSIAGIRVLGNRDLIPELAKKLRADTLLVAVPSAAPKVKQELAMIADECQLTVRILPRVSELVESAVGVHHIREVTEADLLGRAEIDVDFTAIAGYLTGRRVLVTGAGGSIGAEICHLVQRFAPSELIMLDRDESALHAIELSLEGRALLSDPRLVVADIRDRARIREVISERRPDVIFHTAALKHLPLLELYPDEGIKTNVWGTLNLLDAAVDFGVSRFVNISTDKAADPISVLGCTKAIAERLTVAAGARSDGLFVSVRFGNVLGSRGSVLPTFRAQIDAGGPVTVTHRDVTRYFMTVDEAATLVLQAAAVGEPGEVLVLDMGSPVRIDDVARRLIARAERPIAIVYTGLRPGEKLHEQLTATAEVAVSRSHPLIFHTRVPPIDPSLVMSLNAKTIKQFLVDHDHTNTNSGFRKANSTVAVELYRPRHDAVRALHKQTNGDSVATN
jgi:FlaA1/EpsC-like NDP-sugar epimerase